MKSTRDHLLDTAEQLFVEKGPDAVSLRAIGREAGQKNPSVFQYHFGGREGLMQAIVDRRLLQVDERRQVLIKEALEHEPSPGVREIIALMVRAPFLLCREQRDFRQFVGQFGLNQLASEPRDHADYSGSDLPSSAFLYSLVKRKLNALDAELMTLRVENADSLALLALSRRARLGGSFRGKRAELFFNNLVDQIAAMLAAPTSDATQSLMGDFNGEKK